MNKGSGARVLCVVLAVLLWAGCSTTANDVRRWEKDKDVRRLAREVELPRGCDTREAAAEALGRIGKPGVESLERLLKSDNADVRIAAVRGLGYCDDSGAVEALIGAITAVGSGQVARALLVAKGPVAVSALSTCDSARLPISNQLTLLFQDLRANGWSLSEALSSPVVEVRRAAVTAELVSGSAGDTADVEALVEDRDTVVAAGAQLFLFRFAQAGEDGTIILHKDTVLHPVSVTDFVGSVSEIRVVSRDARGASSDFAETIKLPQPTISLEAAESVVRRTVAERGADSIHLIWLRLLLSRIQLTRLTAGQTKEARWFRFWKPVNDSFGVFPNRLPDDFGRFMLECTLTQPLTYNPPRCYSLEADEADSADNGDLYVRWDVSRGTAEGFEYYFCEERRDNRSN